LVSALSASVLQDKRAAASERAALERTVRQRISGRQRHAAAIQRPGVEDLDPATLMVPLIALQEERVGVAIPGGQAVEASTVAPLRTWSLLGGERRLGQRLEVMSRAAERRPKAVDGGTGSPLVQGIKEFFSKIFTGL